MLLRRKTEAAAETGALKKAPASAAAFRERIEKEEVMWFVVFIYINPQGTSRAGLSVAAGRRNCGPAEKGCTGQIGGRRAFGKRLLSPTRIFRRKT